MIEEKQTGRKLKRFIWIGLCIYFLIIVGYCLGKSVGKRLGLEYRFWADACFRIWVWFIPILFAGMMLLIAVLFLARFRVAKVTGKALLIFVGVGAVLLTFVLLGLGK